MSSFYEEIPLKNVGDEIATVRGYIGESAIRKIEVNALVDTGASTLVINEKTRIALGFSVQGACPVTTPNGVRQICTVAESVKVCWKDRFMTCQPLVFPSGDILLGAIPL